MDIALIETAVSRGFHEELQKIAEFVGSDTNDPEFKNLHNDIRNFVYYRIKVYETLSQLLYLVYDVDRKDIEHPVKRDYAIGKKADDILKRLKEIRDYMNSHKNLEIKDSYFKRPLILPIENIQEVLEFFKLIAELYDKMYLQNPKSKVREDLLDVIEKMENWKYRDFNDIFKTVEPPKTENESSSFIKTILIIAGAIIVIAFLIFIFNKIFSKH